METSIPTKNKTHVVVLASPGMGHLIPSLELAKCLVSSHGVHVTLFVPTTTESSTAQSQLLQVQSLSLLPPQSHDLHLINLPPVDITNLLPPHTDIATRISTVVRESLPTVRSFIEQLPQHQHPKVMITDLFATDAFLLADTLKMDKYLFFTSNVTALAIIAYYPKLELLENELNESIRVPGCKTFRLKDLGGFLDRKRGEFRCTSNHARRFIGASGILVNTFEDLEANTLKLLSNDEISQQIPLPRVYPVGPMIRSSSSYYNDENEKSDCMTWLDTQPSDSVLFVSFGSGGTLSDEQIIELAWGLELSQQRFIWVARKPIDITSVYLSAGGGSNDDLSEFLPDGFSKRIEGRGLVVPNWAPQVEILSHVSIGGFLSHCGWNSTLESIVHGVPMIAWPLYAEQHLNSVMLCDDDLMVAVRSFPQIDRSVVGREEIERNVRLLMEGEEGKVLRKRTKQLKQSASGAVNQGGSSYNSLSQLVEKWRISSVF